MANDYESRRLAKIKANQALLAELDVKPIVSKAVVRGAGGKPSAKKRKLNAKPAPSRTSARIAAAPVKVEYLDDSDNKPVRLPRSGPTKGRKANVKHETNTIESLVPAKDLETIRSGWTSWKAEGVPPIRGDGGTLHFDDYPDFTPNKSPAEMLREGIFGGSYYRPLRSQKLGCLIEGDWEELPTEWIDGLDVHRYLVNPKYDADANKYKVACGQSIEEWEAAGWIAHEHDVRGWFQWYTRFYRGRRCDDDERQVSRWKKCVGETGRWRRMLLKKYMRAGVRDVFDDGADEDAMEVSPVMHQTCFHWALEIKQGILDQYWASGGR